MLAYKCTDTNAFEVLQKLPFSRHSLDRCVDEVNAYIEHVSLASYNIVTDFSNLAGNHMSVSISVSIPVSMHVRMYFSMDVCMDV